jgi:hypothetical protein
VEPQLPTTAASPIFLPDEQCCARCQYKGDSHPSQANRLHDPCFYLALAKLDEIPQPEPLVPALALLPGLLDLPEDGALFQLMTLQSVENGKHTYIVRLPQILLGHAAILLQHEPGAAELEDGSSPLLPLVPNIMI